jgi:hypothetical protein
MAKLTKENIVHEMIKAAEINNKPHLEDWFPYLTFVMNSKTFMIYMESSCKILNWKILIDENAPEDCFYHGHVMNFFNK